MAWQGLLVTALTPGGLFCGRVQRDRPVAGDPERRGRIHGVLTMSMAEIFHSFNMRSQRGSVFALKGQNMYLWGAMLGSLC